MSTQPKRPPNELRPRRPFQGTPRELVRRLNDEIRELERMKRKGFTHTTDGQSIDWQISVRNEFLLRGAESAHGESNGRQYWPKDQSGIAVPVKLSFTLAEQAAKAEANSPQPPTKSAWPKSLPERVQAVEAALREAAGAVTPEELAKQFARARVADVAEILETLEALGRAREAGEGKFRT